jgi:hypothetical protein
MCCGAQNCYYYYIHSMGKSATHTQTVYNTLWCSVCMCGGAQYCYYYYIHSMGKSDMKATSKDSAAEGPDLADDSDSSDMTPRKRRRITTGKVAADDSDDSDGQGGLTLDEIYEAGAMFRNWAMAERADDVAADVSLIIDGADQSTHKIPHDPDSKHKKPSSGDNTAEDFDLADLPEFDLADLPEEKANKKQCRGVTARGSTAA